MRNMIFKKQIEFINQINLWGFNTNSHNKIVKGIAEVESQHKEIEELRASLDYDIDGLVYKVNPSQLAASQPRSGSAERH